MAAAAGLVVYALDPARIGAFYEQATGLVVTESTDEHVVLGSEAFQVVVLRVPAEVAAGTAARTAAARTGGVLDPPEREWQWQGWTVCDGHDPEGNVVQLRTERPPEDPL